MAKSGPGDVLVSFGREVCGSLDAAVRREWLVTNGLGGYASGTVAGVSTRRYHGLLVAALAPPVARTVMVANTIEWVIYDGQRYPLSTHEFGDDVVDPRGHVHISRFHMEGTLPVWTFVVGDVVLERRIWMDHGANTTRLMFTMVEGSGDLEIEVTPLVTYRDFHSLTSGQGWGLDVQYQDTTVTVQAFPGAEPFQITADRGELRPGGDWYWNFHRRAESARGLDDREDLYAAGTFVARLVNGESLALRMSTGDTDDRDASQSLAAERERQHQVIQTAGAAGADDLTRQLVLAADQFVVDRYADGEPAGKTIIAGYHWFNDWGRDTMIALPGLTLSTGRFDDAAGILRTFAGYISEGMLPNNFPDHAGEIPGYNTVDATLWYVLAIRDYVEQSGDAGLATDLLPMLREIVEWHVRGTRYGIMVDPSDGLLRAGEPGVQLTWMDAKIGDWVVTPRIGKPVEINALWYNVLLTVAGFLAPVDPEAAADLRLKADLVQSSFRSRFMTDRHEHLADVVDGPEGDDWTLRPNQVFAASLPHALLERDEARRVVDAVGRSLWTDFGLRSLTPDHPDYRATYGGDPFQRDSTYHQGPVWSWLAGPFAEAHFRAYRDASRARRLLEPMRQHLFDAGLGSVSEILEGGPPHQPRGCIAQAWGVAETLRVLRLLDAAADGDFESPTSG